MCAGNFGSQVVRKLFTQNIIIDLFLTHETIGENEFVAPHRLQLCLTLTFKVTPFKESKIERCSSCSAVSTAGAQGYVPGKHFTAQPSLKEQCTVHSMLRGVCVQLDVGMCPLLCIQLQGGLLSGRLV